MAMNQEKRLEELNKQLEASPNDSNLLIEKGFTQMCLIHDGADATFKQAIQANPKNVEAYFWRAYADYTILCGDLLEGKEMLHKALSIDPNSADCLTLLAMMTEFLSSTESSKGKQLPTEVGSFIVTR
jgi:Tfp pilus assembly protein PilF